MNASRLLESAHPPVEGVGALMGTRGPAEHYTGAVRAHTLACLARHPAACQAAGERNDPAPIFGACHPAPALLASSSCGRLVTRDGRSASSASSSPDEKSSYPGGWTLTRDAPTGSSSPSVLGTPSGRRRRPPPGSRRTARISDAAAR